jgi:hypothetical protein
MKEKISLLIYALGIMIVVSFASCDARYDDTSEPCNTCGDNTTTNGTGTVVTNNGPVPTNGSYADGTMSTASGYILVKPDNMFEISAFVDGYGYELVTASGPVFGDICKWFYYNPGDQPNAEFKITTFTDGTYTIKVINVYW